MRSPNASTFGDRAAIVSVIVVRGILEFPSLIRCIHPIGHRRRLRMRDSHRGQHPSDSIAVVLLVRRCNGRRWL